MSERVISGLLLGNPVNMLKDDDGPVWIGVFSRNEIVETGTGTYVVPPGEGPAATVSTTITSEALPDISYTGAYAIDSVIGNGVLEFADAVRIVGGTGVLKNVYIKNKTTQEPPLKLVLFRASSLSGQEDGTPMSVFAGDLGRVVATVNIPDTAWSKVGDYRFAQVECALGLRVDATSLFGALLTADEDTVTFAPSDLTVGVVILAD